MGVIIYILYHNANKYTNFICRLHYILFKKGVLIIIMWGPHVVQNTYEKKKRKIREDRG